MNDATDIPALLSALIERSPSGFALGLHARYHAPTFMFQTYPVEWLEEYSSAGLVVHDPTIAWATANRGVASWAAMTDDPAGVFERARRHGLAHGFTVCLERGGSVSLGSFARPDREFTPDEMAAIEELVALLHDATADSRELPPETRSALRHLSVAFTQP